MTNVAVCSTKNIRRSWLSTLETVSLANRRITLLHVSPSPLYLGRKRTTEDDKHTGIEHPQCQHRKVMLTDQSVNTGHLHHCVYILTAITRIENDDVFVALSPVGLQPAGCFIAYDRSGGFLHIG